MRTHSTTLSHRRDRQTNELTDAQRVTRRRLLTSVGARLDSFNQSYYYRILKRNNIRRKKIFNNAELFVLDVHQKSDISKALDFLACGVESYERLGRPNPETFYVSNDICMQFMSEDSEDEAALNHEISFMDAASYADDLIDYFDGYECILLWDKEIKNGLYVNTWEDICVFDTVEIMAGSASQTVLLKEIDDANDKIVIHLNLLKLDSTVSLKYLTDHQAKIANRMCIGKKLIDHVKIGSILRNTEETLVYKTVDYSMQRAAWLCKIQSKQEPIDYAWVTSKDVSNLLIAISFLIIF